MVDESPAGGLRDQLMQMLEYRVVLGAVVTTMDGLVITYAGLGPDDAEMLAAASSSQPDDNQYSSDKTGGGTLHVLRGNDVRLILLTDSDAPQPAVTDLMSQHLGNLEDSLAV
ncbi:MAG TPA: roadblock/LC7 domain-containing protein [Thermomicrobiales bacterium]|nr:roadblock/LC7 domain-containing protein [Thermomicrobiales bacterium]